MQITLLGTGDAIGTPKIGCHCTQCRYARDHGLQRLRTSLLIETHGHHILVDSSPDLRQQLLAHGSPHIDAVVWTHGHFDHFMGFGEFYRVQKMPRVVAAREVLDYCGGIFRFLPFERTEIEPFQPFNLFGLCITLVEVNHPPAYTCGLVISSGNMAKIGYTSDSRADMPRKTLGLLSGADMLFIDALVPPGIHISKHMNYQEACATAKSLEVKDLRCIHLSHHVPWTLPYLGRDGESFLFPDGEV